MNDAHIGGRLQGSGRHASLGRLGAALGAWQFASWPLQAPAQIASQPPVSSLSAWPLLVTALLMLVALGVGAAVALRIARAQAALREELRQARARAACLETLVDAWLWQSDAQNRLVALRPPAGAASGDWSGTSESASLQTRFACADPAAMDAMLSSTTGIEALEVRFEPSGGAAPRHGLLRAQPLTDGAGRTVGHLGTFRPHPAPAAPVPALVAPPLPASGSVAAAEGGPLADHESFSFTVSHDLRAPIRVVEGFTKIVKEDYGRLLDRVGNDHLDRVLGAAARMNNMIDALLALSKLSSQPLAHQPVNLSQLAAYVADDLRRQWPERQVEIEIQPDLQVQGDPTLLRVVVENLLGNAWKYTGKATQARISFGRHAVDPDTYSVVDNGAGFDMRFADRLFGVFQRLHSANDFPGTGIGLASVRRIVRRHGGEIWGEAEVARGARFHFTLPRRNGAP